MLNEPQILQIQQDSPFTELGHMLLPLTAGVNQLIKLEEKPFLELINLKGEADSQALQQTVTDLTGTHLPTQPNTISESDEYIIYWLAPNEWLIQSKQPRLSALCGNMVTSLAGEFASVVDVSSGNTTVMLSGMKAREVLQKGCPLDLHASVFKPGQCAQSHYFKAGILLRPVTEGAYVLIIRRSFADYFGRILLDACQEYIDEE